MTHGCILYVLCIHHKLIYASECIIYRQQDKIVLSEALWFPFVVSLYSE